DLAFLEQLHQARRRGNHFRERRRVENRIHRHRLALRDQRARSIRFAIHHLPVMPYQQHSPGNESIMNRLLDLRVEGRTGRKTLLRAQRRGAQQQNGGSHCSFFAVSSRSLAKSTSFDVIPWASWVVRSTVTRLYTLNHSG